jgi:hypothetical protein
MNFPKHLGLYGKNHKKKDFFLNTGTNNSRILSIKKGTCMRPLTRSAIIEYTRSYIKINNFLRFISRKRDCHE